MLQLDAVCCSVSQCATVRRSVLQSVGVRWSASQYVAECCVAVCCSVLQCVAVCCSAHPPVVAHLSNEPYVWSNEPYVLS